MNATFDRSPGEYLAYLGVYREVYDAVKEVSPQTLVFPTFQYEQLLGVTPGRSRTRRAGSGWRTSANAWT